VVDVIGLLIYVGIAVAIASWIAVFVMFGNR
jgi:hypothetical protein